MRRKRKLLTTTIRRISRIKAFAHGAKINSLVFILCCNPPIYSISMVMTSNITGAAKLYAYGYEVEHPTTQALLVGSQTFLHTIVFPTLTDLVTLLHSTLCLSCYKLITKLTEEVLIIPPEAFGPSKQMDILKRKTRIDNLLEDIQSIFSLPSFFIIAANFSACGTVIGRFMYYDLENFRGRAITDSMILGINAFVCLICILWIAGGLPVHVQKLKEAFYKKAHLRLLILNSTKEPHLKRELIEKPEFIFTACDILSLKRSAILAIFGTLLTYTVLVINTKDQRSHDR
ncbi:uncharacterized protein NPIL_313161 [Nephila pilipes]|uniref:Gustatory receptor n=1 Tax=Nephila pilipes TaxID=299642 RepID=A0A8X6TF26_NEPPI|nr:uncharacterized protein NPIL_313161 [Nephila pilipes]